MDLKGVIRHQVNAAGFHRQRHEGQLQIGMLDSGPRANERPGLEMIARRQAVVGGEPAGADPPFARRDGPRIQRHRFFAQVLHDRVRVIVESPTDAGQIVFDADPQVAQFRRRADAREQQQLRGIDRSGSQQHFTSGKRLMRFTALFVLDADRARTLKQDAQRQRIGGHAHVAPAQRFAQIAT
ncbi:hypothetical protein D3C85_941580 [compost metagenome]